MQDCFRIFTPRSAQQTGQQGDQSNADEGNTAAGNKLLDTLGLGAGVVGTIPFQKVDTAPYTERTAEGYNEGLQSFYRRIEEFHIVLRGPSFQQHIFRMYLHH